MTDDLTPFHNYIKRIVAFSEDELSTFMGAFNLKNIKKKQFIVQPDFTARYRSYVLQGAFRSYVIDQEGIDHTIQFALEDWWIGDINSYIYQKPATMFIVALEDSSILQISYDAEQQLKASNHSFEKFFRIVSERTAAFHQRRIITSLTRTAEQRYDDFMEAYPTVSQRLPQYALASYLGMTTEFLSKIRNHKLKKKS